MWPLKGLILAVLFVFSTSWPSCSVCRTEKMNWDQRNICFLHCIPQGRIDARW
ncbi:unnamed protein product [Cylicocyclus nassatus]|uniref:Uncharacterized protein n=1 Tax=Cylicocyclus nassatus TaxID=53992 RepID=A0AA36GWH8_CYLNA|nr:unnamed protein product [Cylicocyclus nassatus]